MSQLTLISISQALVGMGRRASAGTAGSALTGTRRRALACLALAGLGLGLALHFSPASAQAPGCDRGCLEDLAQRYMAALVAREPSKLPWAERVRFTENEVALMIGDGAWGTVTKVSDHPYLAADPTSGNVLWYGVVEEHGQPAYFSVRLGVDADGKIAEVESVVGREGTPMPFEKTDGYALDAKFSEPLPSDRRIPRERLVALADGYYNTLQLNDGQLFTAFDPACRRVTNGVAATDEPGADRAGTAADGGVVNSAGSGGRNGAGAGTGADASTGTSCEALFENGFYKPVDRVRARRFPLVDEERGVVAAFAFLDHAARYTTYRTVDGVEHEIPVEYPNSHVVLELIKVEDGKIERIEGAGAFVPYLMPTHWRP
jgi:hypothetical protein